MANLTIVDYRRGRAREEREREQEAVDEIKASPNLNSAGVGPRGIYTSFETRSYPSVYTSDKIQHPLVLSLCHFLLPLACKSPSSHSSNLGRARICILKLLQTERIFSAPPRPTLYMKGSVFAWQQRQQPLAVISRKSSPNFGLHFRAQRGM